ncbi:hypothetical protein U6A24_12595 [Aquimarina gracilis]|uniref:Uncharacterized protein n=1 Tax=Aquimarina gracilis TaxID=874422 RepID=A0ABU5ZWT1_9FLAO|nr:hypothetical protein [Aquimarina gracilis]MEB3346308.1 hypothetical protein [Aquimarina gracilis]
MTTPMYKPIEFYICILGFLSGTFFEDFVLKILMTTVAMVFGTTIAYCWELFLKRTNWKDLFKRKNWFKLTLRKKK